MNLLAAYLVDAFIGDPPQLPHPVVGIGKLIERLTNWLLKPEASSRAKQACGAVLVLGVLGVTGVLSWAIIYAAGLIHPWLGTGVEIYVLATTISAKGLSQAGREIAGLLAGEDLTGARVKVGWIVGRDTDKLDQHELTRATIETVAENIVDGVVAPLFYGLLGGPVLAMLYRASNTMDSMVGYKNERFRDFGWAAARFDDLLNLVPARLSVVFLLVAGVLLRLKVSEGWQAMSRDAVKHPSPNSGYPEATVAGLLGLTLGGTNYYQGIASHRAKMGLSERQLGFGDIEATVRVMWLSTAACAVSFSSIYVLLNM